MPEAAAPAGLVELGAVRGAYGVRGWVRVAPYASDASVLETVRDWWIVHGGRRQPVQVEACRRQGAALLAKWAGCESKEAADALRGAAVAVDRGRFPPLSEGEYYLSDLLGSRVLNRAGESLGEVSGLRSAEVAGVVRQWLEVVDGDDRQLIPLVEPYVDAVEPAARLVRVDWQRDW